MLYSVIVSDMMLYSTVPLIRELKDYKWQVDTMEKPRKENTWSQRALTGRSREDIGTHCMLVLLASVPSAPRTQIYSVENKPPSMERLVLCLSLLSIPMTQKVPPSHLL